MVIIEVVWYIVLGVVGVPVLLLAILLRWATVFPRLGRWLDAKLYRAFPRLGHLLLDENSREKTQPPFS
jgi:hypothetical protein